MAIHVQTENMNRLTLQELVAEAFPSNEPESPDSAEDMVSERNLSETLAVREFYRLVAEFFPSN